jgi:hypothetical protein
MSANDRASAGEGSLAGKALAAVLLAAGTSAAATARRCGVGEKTVRRWLASKPFAREVASHRRRLLDAAAGRLADSAMAAADALRGLLESTNEPIRVAAAKAILAGAVDLRAATEVDRLVEELEARIETLEGQAKGGRR